MLLLLLKLTTVLFLESFKRNVPVARQQWKHHLTQDKCEENEIAAIIDIVFTISRYLTVR